MFATVRQSTSYQRQVGRCTTGEYGYLQGLSVNPLLAACDMDPERQVIPLLA